MGNSYDSRLQIELSRHEEEATGEANVITGDGNEENNVGFSPDLVDSRIKASYEPLPAQISALTEMMNRLIQSNPTKEPTTAITREARYQYESPFS